MPVGRHCSTSTLMTLQRFSWYGSSLVMTSVVAHSTQAVRRAERICDGTWRACHHLDALRSSHHACFRVAKQSPVVQISVRSPHGSRARGLTLERTDRCWVPMFDRTRLPAPYRPPQPTSTACTRCTHAAVSVTQPLVSSHPWADCNAEHTNLTTNSIPLHTT